MNFEYKRKEIEPGEYTPETIIEKLNKYGKDGWKVKSYNETHHKDDSYSFIILLERKLEEKPFIFYDIL